MRDPTGCDRGRDRGTVDRRTVLRRAVGVGSAGTLGTVAGCSFLGSAGVQPVVVDGVQARYAFDDPDTALAVEARGNDGEIVGASYEDDAAVGSTSLRFDGTDDHVHVGDAPALRHTIPMTVSVWAKPASLDGKTKVLHKQDSGGAGLGMMLRIDEGGTVVGFTGVADAYEWIKLRAEDAVDAGQWAHLAWTRGEEGGALYVDGERVASDRRSPAPHRSDAPFQIGARNAVNRSQQYFHGNIDELQYYHRVLSQDEVARLARGEA